MFQYIYIYIYTENGSIYIHCRFKWKMESGSPGDFSYSIYHLLIVKLKFIVCPFVAEETNGSYPFANGLNRLNELAHL